MASRRFSLAETFKNIKEVNMDTKPDSAPFPLTPMPQATFADIALNAQEIAALCASIAREVNRNLALRWTSTRAAYEELRESLAAAGAHLAIARTGAFPVNSAHAPVMVGALKADLACFALDPSLVTTYPEWHAFFQSLLYRLEPLCSANQVYELPSPLDPAEAQIQAKVRSEGARVLAGELSNRPTPSCHDV